jgi:hypothetical protein
VRRPKFVRIPKSLSIAHKEWISLKVPSLYHRRASIGAPANKGTSNIWKYGLTPEEELARIAPADAGSNPERILYGWLVKHNITFTYQEPILGGRMPGGAVLDFVLYDMNPPIIIRVMSYWHESPDQRLADDIQLGNLLDLGYNVEDIWEWEINTVEKVNNKMREVLYGINRRRGGE